MSRGRMSRGLGASCGAAVPPPSISSISPNVGDIAGGITVTITGTELTGASAVTVGGTAGTSVTVVSSTSVTFVTPAKAAALYDVVITTPGGSGTLNNGFESWYPTALACNAVYDAELNVTHVANSVSSWGDQAGVAGAVTQGTAGAKPTYASNAFGTRHGLTFDIGDWLDAAGAQTQAGGRSVFVVCKWTSSDATADVPNVNPPLTIVGNTVGSVYTAFGASAGALSDIEYIGAHTEFNAGSGYNDGQPKLIGVTHNSSTNDLKFYLSSTLLSTQSATYPAGSSWSNIGTGYLNLDGFDGTIASVIILTNVISSDDLTRLSKWSSGKWGTAL